MKKMAVIQFCVLAIISAIVTCLTFLNGGLVACHWKETIGEGKVLLPEVTVFATKYGYLIPLGCSFVSFVFVLIAIKRRDDSISLWRWFTLIVTIELIGIAVVSLFNIWPALTIMYRLM